LEALVGSEDKKNVIAVRALACKVLKDTLKLMKESRISPVRWCAEKMSARDPEMFTDLTTVPLSAMNAAIQRLEATKPDSWTVIDMKELGKRTITEIDEADRTYEQLSEARAEVIAAKREAGKADQKQKHAKSMASVKLSKQWVDHGSSKQVFVLIKSIGAPQST